mmetsp:Transcript_7445/g.33942  ORF Transcript_7445/g.33942 Transcript_7445/m.33942 type:complete len:105 (+) Transcript_7445:2-316(+)
MGAALRSLRLPRASKRGAETQPFRHFSVFVYEYLENTTNNLRYHTNWLACIAIARISTSGLDAASIASGSRKNEANASYTPTNFLAVFVVTSDQTCLTPRRVSL